MNKSVLLSPLNLSHKHVGKIGDRFYARAISVCCPTSFFPNNRSFVRPVHCVTSVCAAQMKALPGLFLLRSLFAITGCQRTWRKAPCFVLLDRTHVGSHSTERRALAGAAESFVDPQRRAGSRVCFISLS